MKEADQKRAATAFVKRWQDRGNERQDSQTFWLDLLETVYDIPNPGEYISFEDRVMLDHTSFIDGFIDTTKVLIEQKGRNKSLFDGIRQSDGSLLSPFEQAKRYSANLPYSKRPRWIITSNFTQFFVYDMEQPNGEPAVIQLKDLPTEYYRLDFIVDQLNPHLDKEMEVSMQAGELVGKIYDELFTQYRDPTNASSQRSINELSVRLVFCLYAEDAGIFGRHGMFHDYLNEFETRHLRTALIDLFRVLDTPIDKRDPYLEEKLAEFPYVNGGMFTNEEVEIPQFTDSLRALILDQASKEFDWSEISPTIFGAVFESTLNPDTRREGGMHYTSIANIHKVIDPMFLDGLRNELTEIKQIKQRKTMIQRATDFQARLGKLRFFDPACGSGNFLTETYLSLRKLENQVISLIYGNESMLAVDDELIKVSIQQFYGIEINDFAVSVGKTALWIAESQMMEETAAIVYANMDFLPLKTYTNITEGNAIRLDWETVVGGERITYIIGNPPFYGHEKRTRAQAADMDIAFHDFTKYGKLDYVAAWYNKAADFIQGKTTEVAFVSTNSITQGEQAPTLWPKLFEKGIEIQFAYRTFRWSSEAKEKAQVHVVIIGFTGYPRKEKKRLFEGGQMKLVDHINAYLTAGTDVFPQPRRKTSISGANFPVMSKGSQPTDGGNLILSPAERAALIKQYPQTESYIRRYVGSRDFINNVERYCIWLKGVSPSQFRSVPPIMERLAAVTEARLKSPTPSVKALAEMPMLFTEIRQPDSNYLAVPEVSSENRRYVPMGWMSPAVIASNKLYLVPNASLYMFGVMTSNVHMAWMRAVAGRMKSDYSYSPTVYANFPWPEVDDKQKAQIEQTAQGILDARKLYPDSSLADLYDPLATVPELRKAHQDNDRAVMRAYGLTIKGTTESDTVAMLFERYRQLTK